MRASPWPAFSASLLALSPAAHAERAYSTNEDDGTVTVIDAERAAPIATVAVGKRPRGLTLSPDGKLLYVAVSGLPKCPPPMTDADCAKLERDPTADGVAVVDTAALTLTRTIRGVSDPERVAVSRDGRRLYVSEEDSARVAVLDAAHGHVLATVPVGREPEGVRVSPDGRWVLATSEEDNSVTIIDARSYAVRAKATVGARPRDLAFSPDSRTAYVSGEADASIYRITLPAGEASPLIKLRPQARPMGLALDAAHGRLYVGTGRAGTVAVVALEGPSLVAEINCGGRPWGIALGAGGKRLFSPDGPTGDVAIINTDEAAVAARVAAGKGPWAVAAGP